MATKKETTSKKINIKNKKEAAKVLTKKTSSKAKKTTAKKKTPTKKITAPKVENKINSILEEEKTDKEVAKVSKSKKETSNLKEDKTKKNVTKKSTDKLKSPNIKKKINKKEPEKTKLVLPKQWQKITEKVKKEKEAVTSPDQIKGKIKGSIFEVVDEKTFLMKKEKEKENIKKTFLIILIVIVTLLLAVYLVYKFNDKLRKQLEKYEEFKIGTKVKLKDDSTWYVIEDSKEHEETVKLLKTNVIDINADSKYDAKDQLAYNNSGESVYDDKNDNSAAKYLKDTYKKSLEEKVGTISYISLLTSKEYVKIREKMDFGYEWSEPNWLASPYIKDWWVISTPKEDSAYVVINNGTYKLLRVNLKAYVRPTIVIRKALVEKIAVPNETTNNKPALTEITKDLFKK